MVQLCLLSVNVYGKYIGTLRIQAGTPPHAWLWGFGNLPTPFYQKPSWMCNGWCQQQGNNFALLDSTNTVVGSLINFTPSAAAPGQSGQLSGNNGTFVAQVTYAGPLQGESMTM